MRMELATEPGLPHAANEDYAAMAAPASGLGGALVLLDGVTPPAAPDGCVHGVPWFVANLGGALLELTVSRRDLTLPQCLADAISRTAEVHRETCDLSHQRTPQATVVLVRWGADARPPAAPRESTPAPAPMAGTAADARPDAPDAAPSADAAASPGDAPGRPAAQEAHGRLEYLVLSDSVLLLESVEGRVSAVRETSLDEVRRLARTVPRAERAARIESLRNAEGGFHTAAADPAVASRAVTGSLPFDRVRSLLALTDGASRWTEVFERGDWGELLALVRTAGPNALLEEVRTAERADPLGDRYPRGKAHDDATAVYLAR
ncbi:hypothetical protein MTQ01_15595 [Streptomyces sp. XM4193]|uniref:hypothetical protein n=1 Tax=Streptomyces sp. XM4193 TaxID=2929782 RepID=UPI001FF88C3C|nr:hypothetical protein [Streptomyces sp. XM4193]MCK1797421.1 hypothetical protein [Streptomyces sp. XM4193]